jgi:aldehyde dehydrogenase (NAD(P)+)
VPHSTSPAALDAALAVLQAQKERWARLAIRDKRELLLAIRSGLSSLAPQWIDLSARAKQLDPASPWVGEEWVTGPWALAAGINGYLRTLELLDHGRVPAFTRIRTRPDGQLVVRVFPSDTLNRLLLSGCSAEVWMQPDVTRETLEEHIAVFYRQPSPKGAVAVVLGAGNSNAIAPLDCLCMLIARGQVVILKMNPVNDYLGPILEQVFAPLVGPGYVRLAYGGTDVGTYLTRHEAVDAVHITGSAKSHDAIVFGPGPEGAERKRLRQPVLSKPITSELGGVGPCIVVPGPWSDADIRFQAEHIATMKLHNSGHNCVATQVLVLPERWDRSDRLLEAVRHVMRSLPQRAAFYPGSAERRKLAVAARPDAQSLGGGAVARTLVVGLDPGDSGERFFEDEIFGPVLAQTSLPGDTAEEFLVNAVRFLNDRLSGTLGATLLAHPRTLRELGPALDRALADLRYGAVGVNLWSAAAFLMAESPWGAFPGHPLEDIQSGSGFVHNTFLLEGVEKTVVRGPFYPFPRSLAHGSFALLPRPPWFVTNRTAQTTARRFAHSALSPGYRHVPGIFASALLG